MDKERFEALIDAYGARPERWPASERAAAEAFAASSIEAMAWLDRARRLDEALDAWTMEPAGAVLRERVVAGGPKQHAARRGANVRRLWWAGAGLAAACAMGMVVGANLDQTGLFSSPSADASAALLTPGDSLTVLGATVDTGKSS